MDAISTQELLKKIEENNYSDIIFDFDETIARLLIDWSKLHLYMKKLAEKYGVESQREEMNTSEFCKFFIDQNGERGKKEIDEVFGQTESQHYSGLEANQALVDFIRNNSEKHRFHILSNNMYNTLLGALQELELQDAFVHIFGRNSVPKPKPFPDGIQKIMQKQGGKTAGFVMIGDNPNSDIAAADNAGIESILINMYI